jgi:hypothetical protein
MEVTTMRTLAIKLSLLAISLLSIALAVSGNGSGGAAGG